MKRERKKEGEIEKERERESAEAKSFSRLHYFPFGAQDYYLTHVDLGSGILEIPPDD